MAKRAGLLPNSKGFSPRQPKPGKGTVFDFSESDIATLQRVHRERQHELSAAKSAEIKRTNPSQYRDPVKLRAIARAHAKLATAASQRSAARRRAWLEQHDVVDARKVKSF